jgi:hypothetical protein
MKKSGAGAPSGKRLSARAQRAMKKKAPQLVEGEKRLLSVRGPTSSEVVREALVDLVRSDGQRRN